MKSESIMRWCLAVCLVVTAALASATYAGTQEQKKEEPKISDGEQKALNKVQAAADLPAKLKAAEEYLKKYGKSTMRPKVAAHLAQSIEGINDQAQRVTLSKQYVSTFDRPEEAWNVAAMMVEAMINQKKVAEAFQDGGKYLTKQPDDLRVLTLLAIAGIIEVQQQNMQFAQQTRDYSAKAVELIEGDRKPALMEQSAWEQYRGYSLPRMYQVQGLLAFYSGDKATAKTRLENATGIDQSDPVSFAVLGQLYDEEYQVAAKEYQSAPPKLREDALKKATEKMDHVIENFARAVAAAEGKAQYQPLQSQLLPVLEAYYEFRHDGKKDGLKEYIEKFKKPAGQ